jgi:acetyl esterase/lipase
LEACKSSEDPLLSPIFIPDEYLAKFPPTHLITSEIDPCLDEIVTFSNRMVDLGLNVTLNVLSGLPHGFLSLNSISKEAQLAVDFISKKIQNMIIS